MTLFKAIQLVGLAFNFLGGLLGLVSLGGIGENSSTYKGRDVFFAYVKFPRVLIIGMVLLVVGFAVQFLSVFYSNDNTTNVVSAELECQQLLELKKGQYFGNDLGQYKAVYNKNLNTCLAVNLYWDSETDEYSALLKDMISDETLLFYRSVLFGHYNQGDERIDCKAVNDMDNNMVYYEYLENGEKVKLVGCDLYSNGEINKEIFSLFDEMFKKVRSYGFVMFDGLEVK